MLTKILSFIVAVISVITFNPLSNYDYSDKLGDENYKGLKDCYADYFDIGAAIGPHNVKSTRTVPFLLKNFSSFTAENAFKQAELNPSEGVWHFENADTIADFCRENGLKLRGHCLVWGYLGSWMTRDAEGNLVSREVLLQRMQEYITTVVTRYKDVVHVWDVVNEPFGYDIKDGAFKHNDFLAICGEEYITKAFEFAHEADPTAVLCLNETTVLKKQKKQDYLVKYVDKWRKEGVPIHAVGIQAHWNLWEINETPQRLQRVIDRLYNIGVDIQITENDMRIDARKTDIFDTVPKLVELCQSKKWSQMYEVLRKNKDKISSVTFWGINDNRPQKTADGQKYYRHELLFDKNNMPKNVFYAVTDF